MPRLEPDPCHVANAGCESPANLMARPALRTRCWRCSELVCRECSAVTTFLYLSNTRRARLCDDCLCEVESEGWFHPRAYQPKPIPQGAVLKRGWFSLRPTASAGGATHIVVADGNVPLCGLDRTGHTFVGRLLTSPADVDWEIECRKCRTRYDDELRPRRLRNA